MRPHSLAALLLLPVLLMATPSSASLSISPTVQFMPADTTMTIYFDTSSTIDIVAVNGGNISINQVSFLADSASDVNATIRTWTPPSLQGRNRNFVLDVNTTTGSSITFTLEMTNTEFIFTDWVATIDGEEVAVGGPNHPLQFSYSDWSTGVNRQVRVTADIGRLFTVTNPTALWLMQYGSAWLALLVAIAIFGVIITSFYVGLKKRKRSGRIWRYKPGKWR